MYYWIFRIKKTMRIAAVWHGSHHMTLNLFNNTFKYNLQQIPKWISIFSLYIIMPKFTCTVAFMINFSFQCFISNLFRQNGVEFYYLLWHENDNLGPKIHGTTTWYFIVTAFNMVSIKVQWYYHRMPSLY